MSKRQALDESTQAGGPNKKELTKYLRLICRFVLLRRHLRLQKNYEVILTCF